MTPAASPPDSPRPHRPLAAAGPALALLVGCAVGLAGIGGCSKPPKLTTDDKSPTGAKKTEPWKDAAARLRKETDVGATKAALALVSGEKLPATSDEALAALGTLVPLSPADREEIRGAAFSPFDAAYLADCFYMRDAARSLALSGLPPEQQADLAFAWVCRQVYLQPWPRAVGGGYEPTVLPPTAVLRRGFGAGLERAYIFLALLQQIGLDGCLIGGPDAGNVQSREGPAITYPFVAHLKVPRGPFWAVGVRVGKDVRPYDPWRGAVFPARLNDLRAKPETWKAWFDDKANVSGVTPDDAKKATVYLAVPVNALSARMAVFETNMRGELGARVAYDRKALEAMRAEFPDPKPAFWNPPNDPFTYGRAARSFLPAEQGGADLSPPGARLYDSYLRDQIPASAFQLPEGLDREGTAASRLRLAAAGTLATAFIEPPNPRERIQRGQFQDAAKDLVAKQEFFSNGLERLRLNRDSEEQIRTWIATAGQLYDDVGVALLNKDKDRETQALAAVESHWKQPGAQFLIDKSSSEVGRTEASFLLALCKHEQAERFQGRLERATGAEAARVRPEAIDAWKTALSAWRTYQQGAAAHVGFPGRAAHARELAARAAKLAEDAPKK